MSVLAITGGTGFVGRRLIDAALANGHRVRALTRRAQPTRGGVEWIAGALDTPEALAELVAGADAVIHVAGVVNAPDKAGFVAGNIDGTRAMLAAASAEGVRRFVHVSSLSAREPQLSDYGWSKAEGDALVMASGLDWAIVRPPMVYGPGDTETLELFRLAAKGVVPAPRWQRFSTIHADDLAALLLALAGSDGAGAIYEADDGRADGWDQRDFARALGDAVGRRVVPVPVPRWAMVAAAWADKRLRGDAAKLTPDRARYFLHPDWTVKPERRPPPALWRPRVAPAEGLAATARWYRAAGLL